MAEHMKNIDHDLVQGTRLLYERTEENHERSDRIAGIPTEGLTGIFQISLGSVNRNRIFRMFFYFYHYIPTTCNVEM
jgi:hypothetical protein